MPSSSLQRAMSFASLGVVDAKAGGRGSSPLPNFTGTWRQVGHEKANEYMAAMGYSYPVRQFALITMNRSTDVVLQDGDKVHCQTVNMRGEWRRTYIENEQVPITTADGQKGNTTAWWEKDEALGTIVHKTRIVGAKQGVLETWRWLDPESEGRMVVKSIVYPAGKKGESTCMYWRFEPVKPGDSGCMLKTFEESYVKALPPELSGGKTTEKKSSNNKKKNGNSDNTASKESCQVMSSPVDYAREPFSSWLERFSDYYYLLTN